MSPTRRTYLKTAIPALVGATTAGCLSGQNRGAADIVLHNEGDAEQTIDLTVTGSDGTDIVTESVTLAGGEQSKINNEVAMEQTVSVTVAADGDTDHTEDWSVASTLHVRIQPDGIVFDEE
ncbi:hypothetical protein [Haloarchaeobius sp. DYHT-AS-18]|uniref:hypothetical protein n=1 Tax=Haloarchaeobius sp. DYHT-AS-18 TaxID=3446117 RepID=UPI003EBA41AC